MLRDTRRQALTLKSRRDSGETDGGKDDGGEIARETKEMEVEGSRRQCSQGGSISMGKYLWKD